MTGRKRQHHTRAWYERRRIRYARLLRRAGLTPSAIARRLAKLSGRRTLFNTDTVAAWTESVIPRREEQAFGVLAEYRQVRDLRDRAYRTLTAQDELSLDPKLAARDLLSAYDKLLKWSLTLSGQAELLGLGRMGRRGVENVVKRMVRQLSDILRDLDIVRETALMQHEKEITKRMLAGAPAWFELGEAEDEMERALPE